MNLAQLKKIVTDKNNFNSLQNFIDFSLNFLEFAKNGFQATIVSQNENHYRFWQFKKNGNYNISRPINSNLIYTIEDEEKLSKEFPKIIHRLRSLKGDSKKNRELIVKATYTIPQAIGATLDSLKAGRSNTARKLAGDYFEQFIRLLIREVGVECETGTVQIPIRHGSKVLSKMSYQHDLIFKKEDEITGFGSVKTTSKDRIDKIFLDKFLYCKLTDTALPHIAIFLNDVQRKRTRKENEYGINATFLSGHFKGYTIKLNPLDGVYYCDIRPNMMSDELLKQQIKTIDRFFCDDIWELFG